MKFLKTKKSSSNLANLLAEFFVTEPSITEHWVEESSANNLTIKLPFAFNSQRTVLAEWLNASQHGKDAQPIAAAQISTAIPSFQTKMPALSNVSNIIAVASGKGGVGKSATTVNLAYALQQEGAKVGIVDADIYGPSIPIMLGNAGAQATSVDNKHMQPQMVHGLAANSIGYLVPAENATVWRGPMASRALGQLLNDTQWPELDYLLVDMPPGTGDIQLTMAQQVPLTGALVVTTPQDLALADATKAIAMFEKVDIPVLGLIENMSYYQCQNCGEKAYLFAQDGGERLAEQQHLPLLGRLPLEMQIRQHADNGTPLSLALPDSPIAQSYAELACSVSQQLAFTCQVRAEAITIKQL